MSMKIEDIGKKYTILKDVVKRISEIDGIDKLFPPQEDVIKNGYLDSGNFILAIPTCSGKTLLSELVMLKTILEERKKAIYIVPLRALASEKYEEFKKKYEPIGIKIALSIGDYDSSDPWLSKFDLIIITSEKLDSLLRHNVTWIFDIGIIIADEIHLLDSPERGPTLEIVLTRLNQLLKPKIWGLSATIKNYKEIADWLNAKFLKSDFRPVKLYKGLYFDNEIVFKPKNRLRLKSKAEPLVELIKMALVKKKQTLIFVSTRKSAESTAEKVGFMLKEYITPSEREGLKKIAKYIITSLESPTQQCKRLASCIENGSAFHHAGVVRKQLSIIENAFREGLIKVIVATPTLAAGINLPAYQVIVRDIKRFAPFKGMDFISNLEIEQMLGRSGRIKYDKEGFGIVFAKNKTEMKYAWENYINGEPEDIKSKLGIEPVLRMHVLALISSGVTTTKKELMNFFNKTFYAYQFGDLTQIRKNIEKILLLLEDFGFIKIGNGKTSTFKRAVDLKNERLIATRIGKRVAELYIDPLSANHLIKSLKIIERRGWSDFCGLHVISACREMKPSPSVRKKDIEYLNDVIIERGGELLNIPNEWDIEYDEFLGELKNACVFERWIEEDVEDKILERFGMTPGELRTRLENADWLLYSMQELALLLNIMDVLKYIRKLRLRMHYGVREELLTFVKLKGIGRIKARKLWKSNIRSIKDLRKIPIESLYRLVGTSTAKSIKKQIGEK